MLHFSEDFVGGFFGFGRTYGAVARFEYDSVQSLDADWPEALSATAKWRDGRKERATVLHLYFEGPPKLAGAAMSFVASRLIAPPSGLAPELRGLVLQVAVFGMPDLEQYMDLILYKESTREPIA